MPDLSVPHPGKFELQRDPSLCPSDLLGSAVRKRKGAEGLERILGVEVSGVEPGWARQPEEGRAFQATEQTR